MKIKISLFVCIIGLHLYAQKSRDGSTKDLQIDSTSVRSIDGVINALYEVISKEKGGQRHWKQFKYLFHPDAHLIPAGQTKDGLSMAQFMTPNEYIKSSSKWLLENGYVEKEIHRKVDAFGNIAHILSVYEAFYSTKNKTPFMRGVNSIQLFHDGKRWWIINLFWSHETSKHPIPKTYLSKKKE